MAILIAFMGFLFIVELLTRQLIEYPKGTTFIVSAIVTSAGAILRLLLAGYNWTLFSSMRA